MNQICTNKKQSSRLLEAGVRPETADMYLDEFERLVFHIKHLLSDLPDDLHRQAIFSYALSSETKKSPKLQDNGLVSFLGQGR